MGTARAESAEAILHQLGWAPERLDIEGVEWAWAARPTPDTLVRVIRPADSPLVHVETTARFLGDDARRLRDGAPLSNVVKLHYLAANLEYEFQDQGPARAVTIADYVESDDLSVSSLGRSVRRVKDAYYATLVIIQQHASPNVASAATDATMTTLAVAPETWTLLQEALTPGQTVDELIRDLLLREDAIP